MEILHGSFLSYQSRANKIKIKPNQIRHYLHFMYDIPSFWMCVHHVLYKKRWISKIAFAKCAHRYCASMLWTIMIASNHIIFQLGTTNCACECLMKKENASYCEWNLKISHEHTRCRGVNKRDFCLTNRRTSTLESAHFRLAFLRRRSSETFFPNDEWS